MAWRIHDVVMPSLVVACVLHEGRSSHDKMQWHPRIKESYTEVRKRLGWLQESRTDLKTLRTIDLKQEPLN
jgi:hypothetical protein